MRSGIDWLGCLGSSTAFTQFRLLSRAGFSVHFVDDEPEGVDVLV